MDTGVFSQFSLFTSNNSDDQIRVTVYKAKQQIPIENIEYSKQKGKFKPYKDNSRELVRQVNAKHVLVPPPATFERSHISGLILSLYQQILRLQVFGVMSIFKMDWERTKVFFRGEDSAGRPTHVKETGK